MKHPYRLFLYVITALVSIYSGYYLYPGNFWISQIFSITFCIFIIISISSKNTFYIFLSVLLWLGFFFKFNASLYFNSGKLFEPVGFFDYSKKLYDNVLIISSVGIVGFASSFLIRFRRCPAIKIIVIKEEYIKKFWIILYLITICVAIINFKYSIYQRATKEDFTLPFIVTGPIQWMLFIGITTISLILLYSSIFNKNDKLIKQLSLVLIIDFIITTCMLSRGLILSSSVIIFLFVVSCNKLKIKLTLKQKIFIGLFYALLFAINIGATSYLRSNLSITNSVEILRIENDQTTSELSKKIQPSGGVLNLVFGRWVGVEGVAATEAYPHQGFELLVASFKDKKNYHQQSFYDRVIVSQDSPYHDITTKIYYAITLPGLIGYLNYSGSIFVVYFGCLVFGLIGNFIVNHSQKILYNPIVSGYIGYLIAYRYFSFGAYPQDTYKFILSIVALWLSILIFKNINYFNKFFSVKSIN